ncbi:MAG: hypothetical protein WC685_02880 [Methylobacter sp.]|jgi:hypothetical protein
MKHLIVKKAFVAASVLSVLGYVGSASAHGQGGDLGAGAKKTDYYQVICGAGTHHLSVQVSDEAPVASPLVSVQVIKGPLAKNVTDPVDGDAAFGPEMNVNGGAGIYGLIVDKTGADPELYELEVHCLDSSGGHPDTVINISQNK